MDEKKKSEILAFFWLVVSILTLMALWTYTPDDIAFEVSTANSPARNMVGIAGAYVAWALMLFFGRTSYFLVPLFLFWAVAKWAGKKGQKLWLKVFSTVIFLASACALFSLVRASVPVNKFQSGGMVGYFAANFLSFFFGRAGIFVALSLFILSILLATELLLLPVLMNLGKKLKPFFAKKPASPAKPVVPKTTFFEKPMSLKPVAVNKPKEETPAKLEIKLFQPKAKEESSKPEIKITKPVVESKPVEKPKPAPAPVTVPDDPEAEGKYQIPSIDLLQSPPPVDQSKIEGDLESNSRVLEDTLRDFGIEAKVVEVEQGPTITRYELQPAAGVKVQKITSLENDISLAMRATSVRIIAPIPGKSRVGIEVPNTNIATVYLKEVLSSPDFQKETSKIAIAIGKDTGGAPLVCNLGDMPHLLIAGATNTGKSVCINSLLMSILFRATPEDVKFLIIDPKMVELHFYNDLPHLICPVVTDKAKAPAALGWVVTEMERRYKVLSRVGAKNIFGFNEKVEKKEIRPETLKENPDAADEPIVVKKMPYIVIVIDELADLIMSAQQEVEGTITRLAQLARAVGIHMILATQRPSVDVITGVIKANFPARIAFQVASKVDSRTILDENGADKLLGRGDLLLMDPRKSKLTRAQGAWVQDTEIEKITNFIKKQRKPVFHEALIQSQEKKQYFSDFKRDEVYDEAKRVVLETGQASVSMVQRRLGIGYTRAARLIDMMEEDGLVGPYRGSKPREILVKRDETKKEPSEETSEA